MSKQKGKNIGNELTEPIYVEFSTCSIIIMQEKDVIVIQKSEVQKLTSTILEELKHQ